MATCGRYDLDVDMSFDIEKWMRHAKLRPRIVSEEEKRYGTFNRRMIAASLDTLLITVLIAPVVDYMFIRTYGPPTISINEIAAQARQFTDSAQAAHYFMEEMKSSGFLDRWTANLRWQIYVLAIYATICWHFWAATPGKIICRLKIIDAKTGGKMGDWQSILRLLGYFLSGAVLGLGFFWIGIDKKRRGWHDLLAGTEVVKVTSMREFARRSNSPAPSAGE